VDDIDGTVVHYDITRREGGGTTRQQLSVDQLRRLIVEAGGVPVERDTLYRRVIREGGNWRVETPPAGPNTNRRQTQNRVLLLSRLRAQNGNPVEAA